MKKTQLEFFKEVVYLAESNPGIKIITCVDSTEIDDCFSWMSHEISSIKLGHYYQDDERIIVDVDEMIDRQEMFDGKEFTYEEAKAKMTPAILVYTHSHTDLQS